MKPTLFPFAALAFCIAALSCRNTIPENAWLVTSPNGNLGISLLKEGDSLRYTIVLDKDTIVQKSALGITLSRDTFVTGLAFVSSSDTSIHEQYTLVTGKRKENQANANQKTITFKNNHDNIVQVVLRAYDDGVAFRYRFPSVHEQVEVTHESTEFVIPVDGKAWIQPYDLPADWKPAYEAKYTNGSPVGEAAPDTSGYSLAALFESNNNWLLLTEAGLDENFYGSHLKQHCENGVYRIAPPQNGEAHGLYNAYATADHPFATPWRTIIAGKSLATIVESNLVYHLSEPNKIGDTSWIKPGRSSWSWWSDGSSSKNFAALKNYVDLSAEMGWEYSLVDANWDIMKGGTIADLLDYARKKNIGLSLWYSSAGPHSNITERPRDIMNDPEKRKAELKKLHDWGVKTVKVDFFNSDKQQLIGLYLDILRDAAAEHIMVVFHGCTLPRGWARTYPNLMAMEGVEGAEFYGWDTVFAATTPILNIIYGFTRNVVGSMDYTPVTFSSHPCCQHATSNAYELALSVLFESGITHFADAAASFRKTDSNVHDFLRTVPTTWDDIKFLEGYPGKELVLARRTGADWYVAAANGEDSSKTISPDLSFLPKGDYQLLILKDGRDNREIVSERISYSTGTPLSVKMLPYGGFAIRITR